jgi:hypothetical protein
MVAWYWLLVCIFIAFWLGYFLCALMVISKESDEHGVQRVMDKMFLKMSAALKILAEHNPLRNDFDEYLLDIAEWGLGLEEEKPNPEDFGFKEAGKEKEE